MGEMRSAMPHNFYAEVSMNFPPNTVVTLNANTSEFVGDLVD